MTPSDAFPAGRVPDLQALAGGAAVAASALARSARWAVPDAGLRFDLAWPDVPAPAGGFPLLVVTDANAMFATLVEAARLQSLRPDVTGVSAPVILGIGHDIDGPFDAALRARDYAPSGAAGLLDRLSDVLAGLERSLPLARDRRTLIGHSLGGLFVLETLFTRPDMFAAFVAASPSIWWDRAAVRHGADRLPDRLEHTGARVRLLLTAGGCERGAPQVSPVSRPANALPQAPATADAQTLRLAERRVVEEVEALAHRLAGAERDRLKVDVHIFEGETHGSVIPCALGRAVRFACEDPS